MPGSKNSLVIIQKTSKKINRQSTLEKSKKLLAETAVTVNKKTDSTKEKSPQKDSPKPEDKKTTEKNGAKDKKWNYK